MELSIFLAKLIGLYMLIVALIMLFRKERFDFVLKDIFSSPGLIAFSGALALISGLAIAIGHPVWDLSWRLGITLIGYLAILQGIARLAFPEAVSKVSRIVTDVRYHWFVFLFVFAVGVFFTYNGFFGVH